MNVENAVNLWLKQALADLDAAKKNFEIGIYYVSAFLSQQAVEKALKALFILLHRKEPGSTHSLVCLGKSCKLPKDLMTDVKKLAPDFVLTRYPDVLGEAPVEIYEEAIAKEKLMIAERVVAWVREKIQSKLS